ncbi:hypothetical protein Vau01_103750 [Virgisporangium aurantiacum]|uniref:Transcriptional regulator n=2 Tax=Virgisporangium aurantiacum TaxID=175570 RepID=A0A8J4E653_9ACTN|nr:hypothetical protein Vau01_103750 [Virgisporangium aurantiacum]
MAGSTTSRVTDPVVADLEELTHTYRKADYRDGSRRVSADVVAHLRSMLDASNRTVSSSTHRRMLSATGDAAQLAAWLAIDAQRYDHARGYCQLAMSLAERANDRTLLAYGIGIVGYIHLHAGDGQAALRELNNARDMAGRGLPPAVGSWLREATGEAYGLLDQSSRGLAALAQAERAFDRITPENTPAWLSFFNSSCHAARLKGRCLTRLHQPKDAIRALHEGLTLLPNSFVRERSGTLIDLSLAYIQLKEIEQACDVARQADGLARRTESLRNRQRLRTLLVELLPWTSLDCVQRLYRQVLLN